MDYKVRVTSETEQDFDRILNCLANVKRNPQAAEHFIDDFENTKKMLTAAAGSLKLCDNPRLRSLGYRRMNFLSMNYFMMYRVEGDVAVIDNIFHNLQDYENKMR